MKTCPPSVRFRPLETYDVPQLLDLYHEVFSPLAPLYSYPLRAKTFREKVLAHPDYDPAGSLIAEQNGTLVGYILVGARTHPVHPKDDLPGSSICLLLVHPAWRRRGIGHELVERARAFARTKGKRLLTNHANPASPFSFFNGVQQGWSEAEAFFSAEGFRLAGRSCTCRLELASFSVSPQVQTMRSGLEAEGFVVEPCGTALAGALLRAAEGHYYYWYLDCKSKVCRTGFPFLETAFLSLERESIYGPDDVTVIRRGGSIVSFVVLARNPGERLAFLGPMWTHPEMQRRGLGSVVLQEALRREKETFGTSVVDLWCSEKNAIGFYARNGFSVVGHWTEWETML